MSDDEHVAISSDQAFYALHRLLVRLGLVESMD